MSQPRYRWHLSVQFGQIGRAYAKGQRLIAGQLVRVINDPGGIELRSDLPATRGDCIDGPRPCPHWRCTHHLGTTVGINRQGRRGPGRVLPPPLIDLARPCVLDLVDANPGGMTITEISKAMNCTPRRAQQLLSLGLGKIEVTAANDDAVADELDAEIRTRASNYSQASPEPRVSNMPQVAATVTLRIRVGDRVAEVTASHEQSRALLMAMQYAKATSVRDLRAELRAALENQ